MSRVFITRHGESMTNIDHDIARRADGHEVRLNTRNNVLTWPGIQQAGSYGDWLKNETDADIKTIVCSPYSRTMQTAFTIASTLQTLPDVHYDDGLREIEWDVGGEFDRLENYIEGFDSKNLPYHERPRIDHRRGSITLESPLDVYERAIPAIKSAVRRYAGDGDLLIVTHYFVVKSVLAWINHRDPRWMSDYSPKNLCRYSYESEEFLLETDRLRPSPNGAGPDGRPGADPERAPTADRPTDASDVSVGRDPG